MPPEPFDVSIVIPVYNGAATIGPVVLSAFEAFSGKAVLEVVLVDDASQDGSSAVCAAIAAQRPGVVFWSLARNGGEHAAVLAGLRRCRGRWAVVMDDDGQNAAEDALRLYETARDGGFDLVYADYPRLEESRARRWASAVNGAAAVLFIGKPRGLYLASFKCLSRRLIDRMCLFQTAFAHIDAMALRYARSVTSARATHRPRLAGRSGYTWVKLARVALDMVLCMPTGRSQANAGS